MVFDLILNYFIHSELIFCEKSNKPFYFHFLHVIIQSSQHCLLKKLFFYYSWVKNAKGMTGLL